MLENVNIEKDNEKYKVSAKVASNYLFRYRSLPSKSDVERRARTINALRNNQLWLSCPTEFNDPYDVSFSYNKSIIKDYIRSKAIEFEKAIGSNRKGFERTLSELVDEEFPMLIHDSKSMYYIASFSTTVTEEIMWAHYANYGKGFALQYEYEQLRDRENISNFIALSPVKYTDIKPLADLIVKKHLDRIVNESLLILRPDAANHQKKIFTDYLTASEIDEIQHINLLSLLYKKKAWQYENEYRLILRKTKSDKHTCVEPIKPKAIYFGEFMPEEDMHELINIANELRIDMRAMKSAYSSKRNRLEIESINIVE